MPARRSRALAVALVLALGVGGCSAPTRGDGWRVDAAGRRGPPGGRVQPNSSKILVQELAFARLVREKGQWTAFRETASPMGVMFVPGPVNAQSWLKDRPDPPQGVAWQADRLFMACNGRTGASIGSWTLGEGGGRYLTVWQNEEADLRKQERWRWVLDHGAPGETTQPANDIIQSRVASCAGDARAAALALGAQLESPAKPQPPANAGLVGSADGSLLWAWERRGDGGYTTRLLVWNGESHDNAVELVAPAAP